MCRILLCATGTEASSRVRGRPGAGHRRRVDDGCPGVELSLRHRVAGRVLPGLADIQQTVLVGVAGIEGAVQNRRLVGRERIVHHHIGYRRIALVGHRQRVVDRLAGHVRRAARNRSVLLDVQDLALRNRNRGVVAVRGRPVAGHRRRVDDGRPGVELGLRHRDGWPCTARSRRHPADCPGRCRRH